MLRAAITIAMPYVCRHSMTEILMTSNTEIVDRRSGYRFRYQLPIRIESGDSNWIEAESRDVSGGGFLLFSPENLPTGEEIEYIVSLPDFRFMKLRCAGKVLRSTPLANGGNEVAVSVITCLSLSEE
jgi:PilZ domain